MSIATIKDKGVVTCVTKQIVITFITILYIVAVDTVQLVSFQ